MAEPLYYGVNEFGQPLAGPNLMDPLNRNAGVPQPAPVDYGYNEFGEKLAGPNLHDLRNRPVSRGGLAPDGPPQDPLAALLARVTASPTGENVNKLLRMLALQTLPARQAGIGEAVLQQSRLAAGSPQEVFSQFGDQISQIQSQLRSTSETIARRGGFNLGGQRERLQGANLAQGATGLQDLFTQAALGGRQGVLQLATGVRPLLATQVPQPRESVETQPFNYGLAGQATVSLAEQLGRLIGPGRTPTNLAVPTPIAPYTPPATQYPQYLDPYAFSPTPTVPLVSQTGGGFGTGVGAGGGGFY